MPSISTENFSSYHIIPLPVNKTKWVITKPYVNFNEKNIQYINTPCPKIEEVENTALLHFGNCNIEINGITYEGSPVLDTQWNTYKSYHRSTELTKAKRFQLQEAKITGV